MLEKLLPIDDDHWIEDESGQRVFKVDSMATVRDKFVPWPGPEIATAVTLAALCTALGCAPGDLLDVDTTRVARRPGRPSPKVARGTFHAAAVTRR